jgi:hypothetical protein
VYGGVPALSAHAFAVGCLLSVAAAYVTDVTRLTRYAHETEVIACGNVTLLSELLPREDRALPPRLQRLLLRMLQVSQIRGAQSGGGAVQHSQAGAPRQLISKCLNSKRGDLAARMVSSLARIAGRRHAHAGSVLIQTHVRFATSSATSRHESHPFVSSSLRSADPARSTADRGRNPHPAAAARRGPSRQPSRTTATSTPRRFAVSGSNGASSAYSSSTRWVFLIAGWAIHRFWPGLQSSC